MTPGANGTEPAALSASGLRKAYRLGEHQSLRLTASRLLGQRTERPMLQALAGVDLDVRRGASVGVVGHNGSGKSTLLQVVAGTTLPTSGTLRVYGRVLPLLAIGAGFHPELTGRENVTLFAASLGIPRPTIEMRMEAVTAFAELDRHMDTPLKRYSSGMMARLSFAISMQFPAHIYIFDEVLAVVDGEFRDRCLAEIQRLHRLGRTVLFVSHQLGQVAEVCDQILWMHEGRVKQFGPTAEVLPAYERAMRTHELAG